MTSRSGVRPWPSYRLRSWPAGRNAPVSGSTALAQGMLAAPGMWPEGWAVAVAAADGLQDLAAQGPDLLHRPPDPVAVARDGPGDLGGEGAALQLPGLAAAVQQPHRPVAVEAEVPVGVGGEPVAVAAVQHHLRVVADPEPVHQGGEGFGADEVAADRVLEVVAPMDGHRTGDV